MSEFKCADVTWTAEVQEGGFSDWSMLMETKPYSQEITLPDGDIFYCNMVDRDLCAQEYTYEGTWLHHELRRRVRLRLHEPRRQW